MNNIIIIAIFSLLAVIAYFIAMRTASNKNKFKNLKVWMSLTREERRKLDEEDKRKSMKKRKSLLAQIRKEYKGLKIKR